jgi:plastocyanin
MTWRARAAVLGTLVIAGGTACGGSDSNAPSAPPLTSTVIVVNNAFQPLVDTVKVGGTITWEWLDTGGGSQNHNIISSGATSFPGDGSTAVPGVPGTDYFSNPHSYVYQFATAGSYAFFCSLHGSAGVGMHGTIDVLP